MIKFCDKNGNVLYDINGNIYDSLYIIDINKEKNDIMIIK